MSVFSSTGQITSGLLFEYDMSNTNKSWKGKPTTNYVTPTWSSWTTDGSGQGSVGTRTIISSYYCRIDDVAANCRQYIYLEGMSANTTYTFSVKYRKISGTPTLRFQLQAYNSGTYLGTMAFPTATQLGITDIDGWQIAYYTVTTPSSTNRVLWFMQDGDDYTTYTHSFELKEPQCEAGSFPTPFVDGTRSDTRALLDLTNNNTATAGNLVYNSDNTFNLSSSNPSYVQVPLSTAFNKLTGTINVWIYPTSYNGGNGIFVNRTDATPNAGDWLWIGPYSGYFYFRLGDGSNCCSNDNSFPNYYSLVPVNTWTNLCCTWSSGGTSVVYINGKSYQSRSISSIPSSSPDTNGRFGLGHANADNYFNGKMPVAQIYNRQLSDDEVLQNFNALRGRYGI